MSCGAVQSESTFETCGCTIARKVFENQLLHRLCTVWCFTAVLFHRLFQRQVYIFGIIRNMLYALFWVIPRRLKFICRRFGTLFHLLHLRAYEDGTECSETSTYKIQTPGNYPEELIQHSEHGESLKSRICNMFKHNWNNIPTLNNEHYFSVDAENYDEH
jgi:hypothetical protein